MRYVTIPQDVEVKNPVTNEMLDKCGFKQALRTVLTVLAAKGNVEALTLIDMRTKFDAQPGEVVQLSDAEWDVLCPEFRKPSPQAFSPAWVLSAEPIIRAVLDAPNQKPGDNRPLRAV